MSSYPRDGVSSAEITVWVLSCWLAGSCTGKAWGTFWPALLKDFEPVERDDDEEN